MPCNQQYKTIFDRYKDVADKDLPSILKLDVVAFRPGTYMHANTGEAYWSPETCARYASTFNRKDGQRAYVYYGHPDGDWTKLSDKQKIELIAGHIEDSRWDREKMGIVQTLVLTRENAIRDYCRGRLGEVSMGVGKLYLERDPYNGKRIVKGWADGNHLALVAKGNCGREDGCGILGECAI